MVNKANKDERRPLSKAREHSRRIWQLLKFILSHLCGSLSRGVSRGNQSRDSYPFTAKRIYASRRSQHRYSRAVWSWAESDYAYSFIGLSSADQRKLETHDGATNAPLITPVHQERKRQILWLYCQAELRDLLFTSDSVFDRNTAAYTNCKGTKKRP